MLNRVVWVTDSGFNSGTNRACLQRGGDHYIVCEKLRSASEDAKKALGRPGRYHLVEGNLQVKEVRVGRVRGLGALRRLRQPGGEDPATRSCVATSLRTWRGASPGATSGRGSAGTSSSASCGSTPGLARFLRRTKDHKLRIDKAAIGKDAHFDGKWLIRTSDDTSAYRSRQGLQAALPGGTGMEGLEGLAPAPSRSSTIGRTASEATSSSAGWALLLVRVIENG